MSGEKRGKNKKVDTDREKEKDKDTNSSSSSSSSSSKTNNVKKDSLTNTPNTNHVTDKPSPSSSSSSPSSSSENSNHSNNNNSNNNQKENKSDNKDNKDDEWGGLAQAYVEDGTQFGLKGVIRGPNGGTKFVDAEELAKQKGVIGDLIKNMGQNLLNGIDVINISLPVRIFEPRSFLERITDTWCFFTFIL